MNTRLFTLVLLLTLSFQKLAGNGVAIVNSTEGIYLEMKDSDVRVSVNNQIAVVVTRQVFHNQLETSTFFRYAFPLHANANAIDLRWFINGKWHEAIINKGTQSDTLPGTPGDPIDQHLLTYLGETPLLFTPLDSIAPDSSVIFELKYVELLPYSFGTVTFEYPNDYTQIQWDEIVDRQLFSFTLASERTIENVEMQNPDALIELESHNALVTYERSEAPANENYRVQYTLSSEELGVYSLSTFLPDSLLYCDDFGRGYVSFIIEPESNVNTEVIDKNFSLIIDRSGSMSGEKIEQAKDAASFIVDHLNFGDRFNIVDFSSSVKTLFPELVPYTLANRDQALSYIASMNASGSTNISGALTTSIQQFEVVDPSKANIIIFFTDGMATAGITTTPGILEAVQSVVTSSEKEIFLFTFGIGNDVDKQLLTLLAQENSGLATFLENDELEAAITSFFLTINNPVLLNTQLEFQPPLIHDIYPQPLPNLYKGQQLIMSGRYHEADSVELILSGTAFNLPVTYNFNIRLVDTNDVEKSFLPKIWAKQVIDHLTIDYHLAQSDDEADAIQALIDSISVCYGVISTEFTSFEDGGSTTAIEYDETKREEPFQVIVLTNPFRNELHVQVNLPDQAWGRVDFTVVDQHGHIVASFDRDLTGTENTFVCDELRALPAGIYYLITSVDHQVVIRQVVKL